MKPDDLNTYFDNGATSFPKPPRVAEAMSDYLVNIGGSYGRSFHGRTFEVSKRVEQTRSDLARMLGLKRSSHVVFTQNATHAINIVLRGITLPNREIVTTPMEHNSVCRPLNRLSQSEQVTIKYLPVFSDGLVDISKLSDVVSAKTDLVVINHQSNINGVTQPIKEIKKAIGDVPILIDAAQSFGHIPFDVSKTPCDYIAITGHKGLLGPTGIGCLYIKDPESLSPLSEGGTGSRSESVETPEFMPDKFEAGTPNIAGIIGLGAAMENRPPPSHTNDDLFWLMDEIRDIPSVTVHCANDRSNQGNLFSITSSKMNPSELGTRLHEEYAIETRLGLHCAPVAHQTIKTFPDGTVRIAPSIYHRREDFEYLIISLRRLLS